MTTPTPCPRCGQITDMPFHTCLNLQEQLRQQTLRADEAEKRVVDLLEASKNLAMRLASHCGAKTYQIADERALNDFDKALSTPNPSGWVRIEAVQSMLKLFCAKSPPPLSNELIKFGKELDVKLKSEAAAKSELEGK